MFELTNESKNNLIIFLLVLLIFSILGINLLSQAGGGFQMILDAILPFFQKLLGIIGMASGKVINLTSNVAAEGTKAGIDVIDGSIQSIGTGLQRASSMGIDAGNRSNIGVLSDNSSSNIQNNISSKKSKWCLVGEYQGKRGCIEIDKSDECISNQTYPNEKICLNPAKSTTYHNHNINDHN